MEESAKKYYRKDSALIEANGGIVIREPVLVLIGPTAIGKTLLSLEISSRYNCEIINMDSMQVYRFMDIGTAKVAPEDRKKIPHHLIDIVDPDDGYHAARFVEDALRAIVDIHKRGAIPLLTGGTGLYLRALKDGLFTKAPSDPEIRTILQQRVTTQGTSGLHKELSLCDRISAEKIHHNDTCRIIRALEVYVSTGIPLSEHVRNQAARGRPVEFSRMLSIGLRCERQKLYERINLRTSLMLELGFENEVRGLLDKGYHSGLKSMQSIGYRHMINYIEGVWSAEKTKDLLARDTRRYAKRQFTWFKKDSSITWCDPNKQTLVLQTIQNWL